MSDLTFNCFVIMPFSQSSEQHTEDYWTSHFNDFLKPLIEEIQGVQAFRIETLREDILRQIITNLVVSPIVIAELTDHNPNLFWELGVRQSFKHSTITIAEEGTVLPFDISAKTTLFYNRDDEKKITEFNLRLKEAISDCIENPNKSDSHVLDTLSGRGSLYEIMKLDEAKRRIEALILETKRNFIHFTNAQKVASELKNSSYIPYELRYIDSAWKTVSLELILSTRYLEEELKFYNTLQFFYETLSQVMGGSKDLNNMPEEERNLYLDFYLKTPKNKVLSRAFQNSLKLLEEAYQKINRRIQIKLSKPIMVEFEDLKPVGTVGDYGWKPYKKRDEI